MTVFDLFGSVLIASNSVLSFSLFSRLQNLLGLVIIINILVRSKKNYEYYTKF